MAVSTYSCVKKEMRRVKMIQVTKCVKAKQRRDRRRKQNCKRNDEVKSVNKMKNDTAELKNLKGAKNGSAEMKQAKKAIGRYVEVEKVKEMKELKDGHVEVKTVKEKKDAMDGHVGVKTVKEPKVAYDKVKEMKEPEDGHAEVKKAKDGHMEVKKVNEEKDAKDGHVGTKKTKEAEGGPLKVKKAKDGLLDVKDVKDMEEDDGCVLFRGDNVTYSSTKTLIQLPVQVKQGMKMTVWGAYEKGRPNVHITITTKPFKPRNTFAWMNIFINWDTRFISIVKGFKKERVKGDFPVRDPSNFTFAVKTHSETGIYVDNVLVKSVPTIPVIKEFNLFKYRKVLLMVIERIDGECKKNF